MKNTMMIGLLLGLAAAVVAAPAVYAREGAEERETRSDEGRRSGQDAELAGLDEADKAAGEHGAGGRAIARKAASAKGPAAARSAGETGKPSFLKRMWNKLKGEKGTAPEEAARSEKAGGEDVQPGREGKAGLGLDEADEAAGEHGAEGRAIARESVNKDASEGEIGAEKREQAMEKREKAMEKAKEMRDERGQRDRGERERGRAMERRGPMGGPMGGPGGAGGGRPGGRGR